MGDRRSALRGGSRQPALTEPSTISHRCSEGGENRHPVAVAGGRRLDRARARRRDRRRWRVRSHQDRRRSALERRVRARRGPGRRARSRGETVVAVLGGEDFYTPGLIETATNVFNSLRQTPGIVDVSDAYTAGGLVSTDGNSSVAVVELDPKLSESARSSSPTRSRPRSARSTRPRCTSAVSCSPSGRSPTAPSTTPCSASRSRCSCCASCWSSSSAAWWRALLPPARRARDDRDRPAGAERARGLRRRQRVRRQRRRVARPRPRRRLQPAGDRPLPPGTRGHARCAARGPARAHGRRGRARGPGLRPRRRDRARGPGRIRHARAGGDGARRAARGLLSPPWPGSRSSPR